MKNKILNILGTRGVPAAHGGFETFAERLSLFLVERGWDVTVYCQEDGEAPVVEDTWHGVRRARIAVLEPGAKGTVVFDWKATQHAARRGGLCLTLGYNTAVFCTVLRLKGIPNLINMDGIEWRRPKWGKAEKAWLYLNDWAGCWLGNHLVADNPGIKEHLATRVAERKITMIPYGADEITSAPVEPVQALGLEPGRYLTLIARPEPENYILELVHGFSAKPRGYDLVVLGDFDIEQNAFHQSVVDAASEEVKFLGAIYHKPLLKSLRFHSAAYVHGHQVGGTNPSLVEAMGAGNAIIAHDNRFNRWVAGSAAEYFECADTFSAHLDELLNNPGRLPALRKASRERFREIFTWDHVLQQYEALLTDWLP